MKTKFLLLALMAALFTACGDNDEPTEKVGNEYTVIFESSGSDDAYTAMYSISTLDNANIYDVTNNRNTQQSSIQQKEFKGKVELSTVSPTTGLIAVAVIGPSKEGMGTLKMTVYKNGKNVYEQSVVVTDWLSSETLNFSDY